MKVCQNSKVPTNPLILNINEQNQPTIKYFKQMNFDNLKQKSASRLKTRNY